MNAQPHNADPSELAHFGALASRWWGEAVRWRASGGRSRTGERPAMEGRAGAARQGWLGASKFGRGVRR
jgi:hypothetical protein